MSLKRKLPVDIDDLSDSDVAEVHDPAYTKYLFGLVEKGRLEELKGEKHVNFLTRDEIGDTLLHKALKTWKITLTRDLDLLTYLLSKCPRLMSETDKAGRTALCYICNACNSKEYFIFVNALIELYATSAINKADENGLTPLSQIISCASYFNSYLDYIRYNQLDVLQNQIISTLELLLKKGGDIHVKDSKGRDLLVIAIKSNKHHKWQVQIINFLIKNGLKPSVATLKCIVNEISQLNIAQILIDKLDFEEKDEHGRSLLHQMFIKEPDYSYISIDAIKLLITNGAKLEENETHIIELARDFECEFNIIEYLLEKFPDYDINTKDKSGVTLLLQYGYNSKNLYTLIKLGADITAVDNSGNNILHKIMSKGAVINPQLFKKIIDSGVNSFSCNHERKFGFLLLIESCFQCNVDTLYLEWIPLLEYILQSYKLETISSSTTTYMCKLVLDYLQLNYKKDSKVIITIMVQILLKYNILIKSTHVETSVEPIKGREQEIVTFKKSMVDSVTYILSTKHIDDNLKEFIYIMFNSGFKLSKNTLTSMTMLMLKDRYLSTSQLQSKLLESGTSIESSVLQFDTVKDFPVEVVQYMQDVKDNFLIPDYVLVGYLKDRRSTLKPIMINHCWFPPIFFVYYFSDFHSLCIKYWTNMLLPCGEIPCGSPLYQVSRTLMNSMIERNAEKIDNDKELKECCDKLLANQVSPASLRVLSKYAVRFDLAKKAIACGSSLPKLIDQEVPPTLHFLVKRDDLNKKLAVTSEDDYKQTYHRREEYDWG